VHHERGSAANGAKGRIGGDLDKETGLTRTRHSSQVIAAPTT
jgi:hypothetical protein